MASERPQYYKNTLHAVSLDNASLEAAIVELEQAVTQAQVLIAQKCPPLGVGADAESYGNIFTGQLGEYLTLSIA